METLALRPGEALVEWWSGGHEMIGHYFNQRLSQFRL